MIWAIFDSTGNLVESHDNAATARLALDAIVEAEPEAAHDVAIVVYGDDGEPTGEAILPDRVTYCDSPHLFALSTVGILYGKTEAADYLGGIWGPVTQPQRRGDTEAVVATLN